MCLDLDKKELKYIINDYDYGVITNAIIDANEKYRAAITLYHEGDCVELL